MPVPTRVQHIIGPQSEMNIPSVGADQLTDYILQLPNLGLAGNCILVGVSHDDASAATESVSDDAGNTYTLLQRVHDTTKGQFGSVFGCFNATAGARTITVTFSAATIAIWGAAAEFNNVATASALDANNGNFSSGTSVTSGSITPTVTGDLLFQICFIDSSASLPLTAVSPGSQANINWTLIGAEKVNGTAVQYGVYNSTAAINPTLTVAPSANYISIGVALKAASAGTAPGAGIRVQSVHHNNTHDETSATVTFFWPAGDLGNTNLLAIAFISSAARSISSITDSSGNTWAQAGSGAVNDSNAEIWYAKNPTIASPLAITLNMSGTNAGGHGETFMAFEISGANVTAPLDTTSSATGTNASGNITADTITPSTAKGLVISIVGVAFDTVTGITTSGSKFVSIRSTGEHEPSTCDENNGWAINYNPDTSSITNVWTHDTIDAAGAGNWAAYSAAFKGPSPAANGVQQDPTFGNLGATQPVLGGLY